MTPIQILPVKTRRQMNDFVNFAIRLYWDCPYYVPELKGDTKSTLNPKKNPAFSFCEAQPFIAIKDGKVVGRVAALINHKANEKWNRKDVRFGWIDFIEDYDVFVALIDAVKEWGSQRGMNRLHGPLGFMDTDREGLMIEGFDRMCTLALAYSYPYYKDFFDRYGFEKGTDWYESFITIPDELPENYSRMADLIETKFKLSYGWEKSRRRLMKETAYEYFDLINTCYSDLYGYTEANHDQIKKVIDDYIGFADLELLPTIRDENGKLIMVGMMIPSLSKAFIKSHGSLFPFGWWPIIKSLYIKREDTMELMLVAIDPEWRNKGVQAVLFKHILPVLKRKGIKYAETNANLEDNHNIRNIWRAFDSQEVKKRRVYFKNI